MGRVGPQRQAGALLGWSCDMQPLDSLGATAHACCGQHALGRGRVRELPVRHGFDIDYRPGSLWAAVRPRRVAMLEQARDEAAERWGYDRLRVIGRDEMPGMDRRHVT